MAIGCVRHKTYASQAFSAGIGGDAYALMYNATDKTVKAVMGSGRTPKKMTLEV